MTEYESISIPEEKKEMFEKFLELRWKEKKNKSEFIVQAIEEFYKNHSESENQPSLLAFQDPDFRACPTFFAPSDIIQEYQNSLKGTSQSEFIFKLQEWVGSARKLFGRTCV